MNVEAASASVQATEGPQNLSEEKGKEQESL